MNILIVGVSGFIGGALYSKLCSQGHQVYGCSRSQVRGIRWRAFDFEQSPRQWQSLLARDHIELVINCAGTFVPSDKNSGFILVHDTGPRRLFQACIKSGLRLIQISAIGAEQQQPVTAFLQSKRNADQYLLSHSRNNVVLYPGIVLGENGRTTEQFCTLALSPLIPLVFDKQHALPLISIYQLTGRINNIINHWPSENKTEVLVAAPETTRSMLSHLRQWLGLNQGAFIQLPYNIIKNFFTWFPNLSLGALNKQSLEMLSEYNNRVSVPVVIKETATESLLKQGISECYRKTIYSRALLAGNILVLGCIWWLSGLVSLFSMQQSRALLLLTGIQGSWGDWLIISAAGLDMILGVLLWLSLLQGFLRRPVIYAQMIVMLLYTLIISVLAPQLWLDPFAPVVKNMALFILSMYALAETGQRNHVYV